MRANRSIYQSDVDFIWIGEGSADREVAIIEHKIFCLQSLPWKADKVYHRRLNKAEQC